MKRGFIVLLVFFSVNVFAQYTFEKNYTEDLNTISGLKALSNGNLIALISDTAVSSLQFTEIGPQGQVVSSFRYSGVPQQFYNTSLHISPSDHLDVVALTFNASLNYIATSLSRFTLSGQHIFTREISQVYSTYAGRSTLSYFPNGDMAVSISRYEKGTVVRLSPTGAIIWQKSFVADTMDFKQPSFKAITTSDGGMLIPGKRGSDNYFVKIDGNGNIQWTSILWAGGLFYTQPRAVVQNANGDYFVCGLFDGLNPNESGGFLMKLDSQGNFIWNRVYTPTANTQFAFTDIEILYSGELVLIGPDVYNTNSGIIMVADQNGNQLSSKKLFVLGGYMFSDLFLTIANDRDICVAFSGWDASSNYVNAVLRSDWTSMLWCSSADSPLLEMTSSYSPIFESGGFFYNENFSTTLINLNPATPIALSVQNLCATTGIPETPAMEIHLSPNPATTQLNIDLGDNFQEGMTYQIIDVLGKVYLSGPVNQSTSQLNIQPLSPGLYFLELKSQNQSFSKKFIKE